MFIGIHVASLLNLFQFSYQTLWVKGKGKAVP